MLRPKTSPSSFIFVVAVLAGLTNMPLWASSNSQLPNPEDEFTKLVSSHGGPGLATTQRSILPVVQNGGEVSPSSNKMDFSDAILSLCLGQSDAPQNKTGACHELREEVIEHAIEAYRYNSDVYRWQLVSSRTLFVAVLLLVTSGVVFAGIQFFRALSGTSSRTLSPKDEAGPTLDSEPAAQRPSVPDLHLDVSLDISASGVKVSSSVLGVIILVISMVFLYLYLKIAYPIQ